MKRIKFAEKLLMALFAFYLVYNTIYGWNLKPIDETEKILDKIFIIGIQFAFLIYISPLIKIYKSFVKKHEGGQENDNNG